MTAPEGIDAQDRDSALAVVRNNANTVGVTFWGTGLVISAHYRRKILIRPAYYINTSIGVGTVPASGGVTLPHQVSMNLGRKNSYLEIGAGGTYWTGLSHASADQGRKASYQLFSLVGYRRHFFTGLVIRIYANPLFHISGEYFMEDYRIIPYGGLSLGHSF